VTRSKESHACSWEECLRRGTSFSLHEGSERALVWYPAARPLPLHTQWLSLYGSGCERTRAARACVGCLRVHSAVRAERARCVKASHLSGSLERRLLGRPRSEALETKNFSTTLPLFSKSLSSKSGQMLQIRAKAVLEEVSVCKSFANGLLVT